VVVGDGEPELDTTLIDANERREDLRGNGSELGAGDAVGVGALRPEAATAVR
jgi:hypothetical protein